MDDTKKVEDSNFSSVNSIRNPLKCSQSEHAYYSDSEVVEAVSETAKAISFTEGRHSIVFHPLNRFYGPR